MVKRSPARLYALIGAISISACLQLPALSQNGGNPDDSQATYTGRAPNARQANDPRFPTQFKNEPPRPTNVVDDGQYVPADGVIDGSNLKQFLNSGSHINAQEMEEASIPADNFTQMPNAVPKSGNYKKRKGLLGAISRGWAQTCNMLGYNTGDDDVGIDASLSSDLPQSVRDAYGAYDPNKR